MSARFLLAVAVVAVSAVTVSQPSSADGVPGQPGYAIFEGREIDLGESWAGAGACAELGDRTECFRTEGEMLKSHPELNIDDLPAGSMVALASCSSSLRLYRSTSFGGGVLALTTRNVILNLSAYGFDNDTSSYRVGACASIFYSAPSGGGSVYSGPTGAFASAASMLFGWDNVVSSVYIF